MARLTTVITSPIIVLLAVPLGTFAAITTGLAFSALLIRVLLVYIELGAVLVRNQLSGTARSGIRTISRRSSGIDRRELDRRPKARKGSSTGSGYSNGSTTPIAPIETAGLGVYGGTGLDRDFEGVGGWRLTSSTDEDVQWTSMNSRLELPSPLLNEQRRRHHHRSSTSGSVSTSKTRKSPVRSRARTPWTPGVQGIQPAEYFGSRRAASKSTTSLNTDAMLKPSSHEDVSQTSTTSMQSTKTMQANTMLM